MSEGFIQSSYSGSLATLYGEIDFNDYVITVGTASGSQYDYKTNIYTVPDDVVYFRLVYNPWGNTQNCVGDFIPIIGLQLMCSFISVRGGYASINNSYKPSGEMNTVTTSYDPDTRAFTWSVVCFKTNYIQAFKLKSG